jgi:hypothetical protein
MARTHETTLEASTPKPENPWRMPGFFAAAAVGTAITMAVLSAVAGPAPHYSLAPVWGPGYMTYPMTVATAK